MSTLAEDAKAIFLQAIEKPQPEDWPGFLDQACGEDRELRQRVEGLLQAHQEKDSLFDYGQTREFQAAEQPGQMIGPYKLRERLGVGGMGVVWAAEQKSPLRRKVAVKVIKAGMDSEQVLARFEAEREALSLMEHPNIARVLDAGVTKEGRPYFAMELIRGIPITEYCDSNKLSIRDRLKLFLSVCAAVQHAHRKGIIHRDIKPSNVLVGEQDGQPVAKVIDFGVAKALHQSLTSRTVYTGVFQAIGTLAYMSPEQAGVSISDIDTRADIYGLGVLLYELITGNTPFDRDELASAAMDEAYRIIREIEPPKPSTKLSSLGEKITAVSQARRTDASGLGKEVRGELDWIVMKSLEKDRGRRYGSAESFAADITRYLSDEPVTACPPSTYYRLRKSVQKHRARYLAGGLLAVSLLLGLLGTTWQWQRAVREAKASRVAYEKADQLLSELADELVEKALGAAVVGDEGVATEALARALRAGASAEWKHVIPALLCHFKGDTRGALKNARLGAAANASSIPALGVRAMAELYAGNVDETFDALMTLKKLTPQETYDYLFAGYPIIYADSKEAERLLGKVVEDRPYSALARAMYSEALAQRCMDTDKFGHARDAMRHAAFALDLLPDNPYALTVFLHANHVALRHAERLGVEVLPEWQHNADFAAAELSKYESFVIGAWFRAMYYIHVGDLKQAEKLMRNNLKVGGGRLFESYLQAFLFAQNRTVDAIEISSKPMNLLLFADVENGKALADKAFQNTKSDSSLQRQIWANEYLAFSGQLNAAQQAWKELREQSVPTHLYMLDAPLNLWTGNVTLADLTASKDIPHKELAAYLYYAAHWSLMNGQRDAAREYFKQVVDLAVFTDTIGISSEGYLKRIEDEDWPNFQ